MKTPGAAGGAIITLWAKGIGDGTGSITREGSCIEKGT